MASIAVITPELKDPITGAVIRKASVSVPKRYSPPNKMPISTRTFKSVQRGGVIKPTT